MDAAKRSSMREKSKRSANGRSPRMARREMSAKSSGTPNRLPANISLQL
jgi:hypothetical protein